MSMRHDFAPVRRGSFSDTNISAINAAREAVRRIPEDILKDRDVVELVSGILGRYKSTDAKQIDMLLKMAAADYVNTAAN